MSLAAGTRLGVDRLLPVFRLPPGIVDHDVAPDGRRFLAAVPISPPSAPALSIVLR